MKKIKIEGDDAKRLAAEQIEQRAKEQREAAEAHFKAKVDSLLFRHERASKQVVEVQKILDQAKEAADELAARIDKVKAGDVSGFDEPEKSADGRVRLSNGAYYTPPNLGDWLDMACRARMYDRFRG